MALRDDAKVDVLGYIGKLGSITLAPETLILSRPAALTADASGKNTAVKVTMLDTASYAGTGVYKYDRIDLANMVKLFAYAVPVGQANTLYDFIDRFKSLTGINVSRDDLDDSPVVENADGSTTVLLRAKATSLRFTGEGNLAIRGLPSIRTAFTSNTMLWS